MPRGLGLQGIPRQFARRRNGFREVSRTGSLPAEKMIANQAIIFISIKNSQIFLWNLVVLSEAKNRVEEILIYLRLIGWLGLFPRQHEPIKSVVFE